VPSVNLAAYVLGGGDLMRKYTKPTAKKVGFGAVLAPAA
jgi:hypothetical protein